MVIDGGRKGRRRLPPLASRVRELMAAGEVVASIRQGAVGRIVHISSEAMVLRSKRGHGRGRLLRRGTG